MGLVVATSLAIDSGRHRLQDGRIDWHAVVKLMLHLVTAYGKGLANMIRQYALISRLHVYCRYRFQGGTQHPHSQSLVVRVCE